jgi:hypothetical protein
LCGIGRPGSTPESILSAHFTIYSQYERLLRKSPVGACIFKLSIKLQLEELAEKCHLLRYGNAASFGTGCNGIRLQNGRGTLSLDAFFSTLLSGRVENHTNIFFVLQLKLYGMRVNSITFGEAFRIANLVIGGDRASHRLLSSFFAATIGVLGPQVTSKADPITDLRSLF